MTGEQILTGVVTEIYSPIYQAVAGVAVVYFLYGVAMFIFNLNNPEKREDGKRHLLYGTIGLFIILSVGGILNFLNGTIGGMFK
jgi:hypothetical protein